MLSKPRPNPNHFAEDGAQAQETQPQDVPSQNAQPQDAQAQEGQQEEKPTEEKPGPVDGTDPNTRGDEDEIMSEEILVNLLLSFI